MAESVSTLCKIGQRVTEGVIFPSPESVATSMKVADILEQAASAGLTSLSEADGKRLLAEAGIAVPRSTVVRGPDDVFAALDGLSGPFAVKVMSPDILHKSDAGAVAIGLTDLEEVAATIRRMGKLPAVAAARVEGYLVEEMAPPGREAVIGGLQDPQFGPMVMVGLGGIFVEVLQDVSFRLCPIDANDANAMLAELRGASLLDGARGQAPASRAAIVQALIAIGGVDGLLLRESNSIAELDINPLIVGPENAVAVDARVILRDQSAPSHAPAARLDSAATVASLALLFEPHTVAVVGASANATAIGNTFIRRMQAFDFAGELYPIHPDAERIEGLPAYRSLADTPKPVDYAYIAIGAERIPQVLAAAKGNVRVAQVISSGFREVGNDALEAELLAAARVQNCRLIGPNCLGTYSPRGDGLTFPASAPRTLGTVGVMTQSGGLGTDIVKRGQWKGIEFSGLVTAGNCTDVGPCDLLEFYLADDATRVIGMYLEDIGDGRRFFDLLRNQRPAKPVVILRGGRSESGRAAAASHTGALAGDGRGWHALAAQAPVALVDTVDEFLDVLLALQDLELRPRRPTRDVALFGNGGGTSVLATDFFAECGLRVAPFGDAARVALDALALPPGTSVVNPVDTPVATLQKEDGRVAHRILDIIYSKAQPDAVVMHLNLAAFVGRGDIDPVENLLKAATEVRALYPAQAHFALVLRVDGSPELDDAKRAYRELARGIPVFDELPQAARALAALSHIEARLAT